MMPDECKTLEAALRADSHFSGRQFNFDPIRNSAVDVVTEDYALRVITYGREARRLEKISEEKADYFDFAKRVLQRPLREEELNIVFQVTPEPSGARSR